MAIGIILGIVIGILVFVCGGIAMYCFEDDNQVGGTLSVVGAVIMAIAFVIVPFSFRTVDAGQVAVVKHLGQVKEVKTAGTYFDIWITNTYMRYDSTVQNVDIATAAYSSDAQTMTINMTLQYQIVTDKVTDIVSQYGSLETLQNRIQSVATEKTKSVLSAYKAMDIIADRAAMSPAVEAAIKDAIGEGYYVNVHAVVLTNIDFSDAFELAVEEKMIAEQAKLKAEYENQTKIAQAEAEAEARLKEAEAQVEIAEAEAEALMIKAEAEAEANRIISESITDELLDKIIAENWDGKLPAVMGSEGQYILPSDIFN